MKAVLSEPVRTEETYLLVVGEGEGEERREKERKREREAEERGESTAERYERTCL